ncbi:MAG: TRAP transporter substrate-binding protein DctP [Treponema sp.]|nr:TRAP transporter substrate-binding protein DctP [Treponema sp.]
MKITWKNIAIILIVFSAFLFGSCRRSASDGPIVLRVASAAQIGDSLDQALNFFVQELSARTDGAITGEVFSASQLGHHSDYIAGLQMGSIHVAEITAAVLSTVAPRFAIFDLPYISESPQALFDILDGEAGDILTRHIMDVAQIRPIGWMVRTPRHVYSSAGPIRTVEDFRNLRIRTMQSAPMIRGMELLGAFPSAIPTAERYTALQTGVVDAAENNVAEIWNTNEWEVTRYLSKTAHLVAPNVISIGTRFLESLSEEHQRIIIEVGREAGMLATRLEIEGERPFEELLATQGEMIINEIEDMSSFVTALAPLHHEWAPVIGADLIALFRGE